MDNETYAETFALWAQRSQYQGRVVEHLREYFCENPSLSDSITSVLSVGPGEGDLDIPLITQCLPNVQTYHGVDPRPEVSNVFKQKLKKWTDMSGSRIKVSLHTGRVEDYPGPGTPVDLLVAGHVLYYLDDLESVLDRCTTWINPGGVILLSHSAPQETIMQLSDVVKGQGIDYRVFHNKYQQYMASLMGSGFTVDDRRVQGLHADFSEPGTTSALKLILNVEHFTPAQFRTLKDVLKASTPGGNMRFEFDIMLAFIHKPRHMSSR